MQNTKQISRIIGILFISAFFFYGIGNGLVDGYFNEGKFEKSAAQSAEIGIILMLSNSLVVVLIGYFMNKILTNTNKLISKLYFFGRIIEALSLALGVIILFKLLNLSLDYESNNLTLEVLYQKIILAKQYNFEFFNVGMLTLGLSSLVLFRYFLEIEFIPKYLSIFGLVGYGIFSIGAGLELANLNILGEHTGILLSIPGGLFELTLGIWLIVKGFEEGKIIQS